MPSALTSGRNLKWIGVVGAQSSQVAPLRTETSVLQLGWVLGRLGIRLWLCHLRPAWPWASHLPCPLFSSKWSPQLFVPNQSVVEISSWISLIRSGFTVMVILSKNVMDNVWTFKPFVLNCSFRVYPNHIWMRFRSYPAHGLASLRQELCWNTALMCRVCGCSVEHICPAAGRWCPVLHLQGHAVCPLLKAGSLK